MTTDETIREHVEAVLGDDWDLRGITLASDDDEGRLYLLVYRSTTSERGNLILSERYYRYDPVSESGQWLDNGIERRVTGSLAQALMVMHNGLARGGADVGDPMLIDSRGPDLDQSGGPLDVPLDQLGDDLEPLDTADEQRGVEPDDDGGQETNETAVCDQCGAERPVDELATASLGTMQTAICRGECVGGDDGED